MSNGWEDVAGEFIAAREQSSIGVEVVRTWARNLSSGAAILDLGCGTGVPISQALIDDGFRIYGVDASRTLLAEFQRRFPQMSAACEPVESSAFFSRNFDGVVAIGLMFLLPADVQRSLIFKVASALNAGGHFLFTSPSQICTWADLMTGRESRSLGEDAYITLLSEAGLSPLWFTSNCLASDRSRSLWDESSCTDVSRSLKDRMRTLIALSVAQTLGIFVLMIHSFGREDRIEPEQGLQNPAAAASPAPMRAAGDGASLLVDEERLRNIIRQELAQLQAQPNTGGPSPPVVAPPRNESADRYRQEQIAQQIEAYRAAGSISEEQMQELQAGIAQLDAASRRQMMSKLIRTLNSGDLHAQSSSMLASRTPGAWAMAASQMPLRQFMSRLLRRSRIQPQRDA